MPYILVVGDEDVDSRTVGVNRRGSSKPQRGVPLEEFVAEAVSVASERGRPEQTQA